MGRVLEASWLGLGGTLRTIGEAARTRRTELAGLGVAAVLCYGYELAHFTLSVDEELFPGPDRLREWIEQDRPAVALLKVLLGHESVVPFLGLALSLVFLVAAAGIWWLACEEAFGRGPSRPGMLAFGAAFVTCPSLPYFLCFDTFNLEVSIGGAAAATAGLVLARSARRPRPWAALAWCGLLVGLSTLVYQAFVPVWLCGAALVLLLEQLADVTEGGRPVAVRRAGFAVVATVIGLATSQAVVAVCHRFVPKSAYVDSFVRWGQDPFPSVLRSVVEYVLAFPRGSAFWGGDRLWLTYVVAVLALGIAIAAARGRRAGVAVLGLAFAFSPFALAFLLGSRAPVRSMQALAVFLGGAWGLAFLVVRARAARVALGIALLWLVCWQSMRTNALFFGENLRWQADRDVANRILDRVYSLDLGREGPWTLVIVGALRGPVSPPFVRSETIGASFFEWEGGNPWRILSFVQSLGNERFTIPGTSSVEEARRESEGMPEWPAAGSVALRKGIVIVKLSAPASDPGRR